MKSVPEHPYICIEGNIGSGKTTLSHALSKYLSARLVLEEFTDNPFLERFYQEPQRYAFSLEMAFLADRYHQLSNLHGQTDLFQPTILADYAPFKSLVFAQNNLDDPEFKLYRTFWQMSLGKLREPDLVLYLQRPVHRLLENIAQRGRSYEMEIESEYLENIHERYQAYFKHHRATKTLFINAEEYDFKQDPNAVVRVWQRIEQRLSED